MICPNCEKEIANNIAQCPHCGCHFPVREIPKPAPTPQPTQKPIVTPPPEPKQQEIVVPPIVDPTPPQQPESEVTTTKFCKHCGKQIVVTAAFCKFCGNKS